MQQAMSVSAPEKKGQTSIMRVENQQETFIASPIASKDPL